MSGLPAELANIGGGPITIAGKYRVERVLGEGGMGIILEATHLQLEERVAIKVLRADLAKDEQLVARFLREARTAIKIRSEHVVRILDVASLDSGAPYIVMELLVGTDLDKVLSDRGPLRPAVAVDYVLQVCEALAEAHARGMVHRDLKPANLFLTQRSDGSECVKVLDFGITKLADTEMSVPSNTSTQEVFGSPTYMSPEQMRSTRKVDARADIWALGIILYELVALSTPFNDGSMPELCAAVLHEEPHPLPPQIPAGLAAVVMKCLRKPVDERYRDVGELASALAPFAADLTESARTSTRVSAILRSHKKTSQPDAATSSPNLSSPSLEVRPSLAAGSVPSVTSGAWGRDERARGPRHRTILLAAAGALVVAAVIFFAGYRLARPPAATATASTGAPTAPPAAPPAPAPAPSPEPTTHPTTVTAATAEPTETPAPKTSAPVAIKKTPTSAPKPASSAAHPARPPTATATHEPAKPPAELFDQRK